MRRLAETVERAALSLRTLPDKQLTAEREALRTECAGTIGAGPGSMMLKLYDAEASRRQREGSRG
jgi:hypothetical protein